MGSHMVSFKAASYQQKSLLDHCFNGNLDGKLSMSEPMFFDLTSCFLAQGTIAVYRLSVMYHTTTSWTSTGPGTLNSSGAKAAFYIFHVFPEWLASVVLFSTSVRKAFGTGLVGDYRFRDETPAERQTRLEKEAKKAEKKKEKFGTYEMTIERKV